MGVERHVKLFKNGRSGEDAIIRKEGNKLIIETPPPRSLLALLATLDPIDEALDPFDDAAPEPIEL